MKSADTFHLPRLACRTALLCAALSGVLTGCANAELSQADLDDINKLVQQHSAASKSQRLEAEKWFNNAGEAVKQARWDLAAKMYGEALIRYPSFAALQRRGEATARSDRTRDTTTETLTAQKAAFASAASTLRMAVLFAEKVPGQAAADQLESTRAQIRCLDAYDGSAVASCEPVASALKRYENKRGKAK